MANLCVRSLGMALLAALPLMASAELSANIALTSNYKFRGQDQDANRFKAFNPALQGGLDYNFGESGWYVGNWNSSVDWLDGNHVETDFYGGYKFKAGEAEFDIGALRYLYPGAGVANSTEVYLGAAYGIFNAKYSHTVSKRYFGLEGGKNSGHLNVGLSYEVAPQVTLDASLGFTRFSSGGKRNGAVNYADYSLGATYDFGNDLSLSGALVGATKKSDWGEANKNRFVVTLSKTF